MRLGSFICYLLKGNYRVWGSSGLSIYHRGFGNPNLPRKKDPNMVIGQLQVSKFTGSNCQCPLINQEVHEPHSPQQAPWALIAAESKRCKKKPGSPSWGSGYGGLL